MTNILIDDDFSDVVCGICRTGGDMICCDGRCLRSFHPKCINLNEEDIPEDAPFVCSDCFSGVQRCFICCHFGMENELVKCSVAYCGKFYHPSCVNTSIDTKNYVCKLHSCDACGDVVINPSKRNTLWRCFRCPKAFDSKHRPRDVHVLAEGVFLCIRHTQEEEIWPEMSKSIVERLAQRNQVKYITYNSISNIPYQQSADWENKNINASQTTNTSTNRSQSIDKKQPKSIARRSDETAQEYQRRLKQEEKDRLDDEATLRASSIMPKKRPSTELSSATNQAHSDEDDANSPRFSPASIGDEDDDELHSVKILNSNLSKSSGTSHLARHNEYRRQRKGEWNESWNQYRNIQDESMGITRRSDLRGYYQQHYEQPVPRYPSEFSFTTSFYPSNSSMNQTNTMLSSSYSSAYMNRNVNSNPSSTAVLMRTDALLNHLSESQYESNKRLRYDHNPPLPTSALPPASSSLPYTNMQSNGYVSSRGGGSSAYDRTISHNYNGSRFDMISSSSPSLSPSRSMGSTTIGHGASGLSRTENLLAKSSYPPSTTAYSSSSSKPLLSRTEQLLAKTSREGKVSQQQSHSNPIPTNPTKLKSNKMEATDLFAMLQASGLLPTNK